MREINTQDCHVKFGKLISNARIREGMSQAELATKLELSQPYLCRIENGRRDIDLALAMKFCKVLKLDFQEFVKEFI